MKKTLRVTALGLALACGCGVRGYTKPGTTYREFMRDFVVCESLSGTPVNGYSRIAVRVRTNRCMIAMGYDIRRGDDVFQP